MTRRSSGQKSEQQKKDKMERLKDKIIDTLMAAMDTAQKDTEKVSAANAAIKYLAVEMKVPVESGGGFGEE